MSVEAEIIQDLYDDRSQLALGISLPAIYKVECLGRVINVSPYILGTYDRNLGSVSKAETGLRGEVVFLKLLYLSFSGQYVSVDSGTSLKEQYVSINSGRSDIELIGEFGFKKSLPLFNLSGAESYIFEIGEMRGTRNELTAGIEASFLPLNPGLRWRHIDLIHGPDTDEVVLTFTLQFP